MDPQATTDETFAQMSEKVSGDRVHSNNDQRKRPAAVAFPFDHPGESGQEQEANAAAEERPGRCPDPLDDGTNAGEMENQRQSDSSQTKRCKPSQNAHLFARPNPATRYEPEDHGSERRNEAQSQITAAVCHKRVRSGEEIEKPLIEGIPEIAVFIPMRSESGEIVVPV